MSSPSIVCIPSVTATGSVLGGVKPYDLILNCNSTILIYSGHAGPEDVELIHALAEAGKKIMHIQHWWSDLINNPLLIFYNETYKTWALESLNFSLYGTPPSYEPDAWAASINPNDLWGVTIGDEEPAWLRYVTLSHELSPDIARYSDEYYTETGYEMKPTDHMNLTEYHIFEEWMNEKTVWVYSFLYDHVRIQVPHAVIFQYMIMPPVWGINAHWGAPYEIKADGISMDCFYAVNQPWLLYETNRRYRAGLPDKEYIMNIWGTIWDFLNEAGDGLYYKEGSYEQIRRETWISYLSSIDALGYFSWAPQYNDSYNWAWGSERTDVMGQRLWRYTDNLAGQLNLLPKFNPTPEVLIIGSGYQTGEAMLNVADMELFCEYDMVNLRQFSTTNFDLSNYSLILVTDTWYYDETISKLNEYVDSGGNLMFLGVIRSGDQPIEVSERFEIEENATETGISGHVLVNFTRPNLLNLCFESEYTEYYSYSFDDDNLTTGHHPVGDFYYVEGENLNLIDYCPLLLYHNDSKPDSGWTLWFGTHTARNSIPQHTDKKPELWNLTRQITRGFAEFLNITNSISQKDTENILITAGPISSSTIMGGVYNFENQDRDFNFTYDLSQLGFPDGNYFIHSLDTNHLVGQFQTNNQILSFETEVVANGSRLFLISETLPNPGYSIDIFPPIPPATDFTDLATTTTTTTETTMETSTTSTTTTNTTTQQDSLVIVVIGGLSVVVSTLVLYLWIKRRNR